MKNIEDLTKYIKDVLFSDINSKSGNFKHSINSEKALYYFKRIRDGDTNSVRELKRLIVIELLHLFEDKNSIKRVLDLESTAISSNLMYEILMYFYYEKYGNKAMNIFINRCTEETEKIISNEDLKTQYNEQKFNIDFDAYINIIAKLIYQKLIGFEILDNLLSTDIDGFILMRCSDDFTNPDGYKIQVNLEGKCFRLEFICFESIKQLQNIISSLS